MGMAIAGSEAMKELSFMKSVWPLLKQTCTAWSQDKVSRLAAALAYYTIFSIAPLLIIAIAVVGFFLGERAARGEIHDQLKEMLGDGPSAFVQDMVKNAGHRSAGTAATVISLALILYAASSLFTALQDSLNDIFKVTIKPGRTVLALIRDRVLSFVMVLVIAAVLLVAMALSAAVASLSGPLGGFPPVVMQWLNVLASVAVFTLLFAMIFKFLPDIRIRWRDAALGAFVTAVGFTVGKWAVGLYLARATTLSIYGAAGSLVLIVIFVYYSMQILLLGAEFTKAFAHQHGTPIGPASNAMHTPAAAGVVEAAPRPAARATGARHLTVGREMYPADRYNLPHFPMVGVARRRSRI